MDEQLNNLKIAIETMQKMHEANEVQKIIAFKYLEEAVTIHIEQRKEIQKMASSLGYSLDFNAGELKELNFSVNADNWTIPKTLKEIEQCQCRHNYVQKDSNWKSCTHCGMLATLVNSENIKL